MKLLSLLLAASMAGFTGIAAVAQDGPTITQAELVRRTQQMYTALMPADKTPWQKYLADDVMIFDEKGHNWDKAQQLADIEPFPPGYSGSIQVANAKAHVFGNVAILSYDCNETEDVFTNHLHARYHSTDTWLYRNQLWQIVASQTLRYYEDPAAARVNAAILGDYIGTYELAPGTQMVVTQDGGKLLAKRGTGKPVELLLESGDVFFRTGVEGRRLFHRNAAGKVDTLIDRRNNEDLLWKKVS